MFKHGRPRGGFNGYFDHLDVRKQLRRSFLCLLLVIFATVGVRFIPSLRSRLRNAQGHTGQGSALQEKSVLQSSVQARTSPQRMCQKSMRCPDIVRSPGAPQQTPRTSGWKSVGSGALATQWQPMRDRLTRNQHYDRGKRKAVTNLS